MSIFVIIVLAVVQGAAELLPISSSAHVILVELIFGLDPTSYQMTFLLVMLHTGTMFAVLVYFWRSWAKLLARENPGRGNFVKTVIYATVVTGIIGLVALIVIPKVFLRGVPNARVEDLFGNVWIIASGLAAAGILTVIAGFTKGAARETVGEAQSRTPGAPQAAAGAETAASRMATGTSILIGVIQGLALPFRGFSRSGSTISAGLLSGIKRRHAEVFSFTLALILTLPLVAWEALQLRHIRPDSAGGSAHYALLAGLLGMVFSFGAGLAAIRWLSAWLEKGRWGFFGIYCIALSALLYALAGSGILR